MKKTFLAVFTVALSFSVIGQSVEEQYAKALKLKTDYNYKDALPLFQALLKTDSSNIDYVQYSSYCYSKTGFFLNTEAEKMKAYHTAEYLAKKAISLDEKSADAHYVYALALGRINENASSKQKIANAKLIKNEVDRAIALNPKLAGAYHILGRWNKTIAGFNAVEKVMINSFFGGVPPGGSYQDAVNAFMTAIKLEPQYMLHQYQLADTYHEMGKDADAKVWLEHALKITPTNDDDRKSKTDCEVLLKKLK